MVRIKRKSYLDFLLRWKDKQIIKVISGIRRCGKSTLFDIYKDYLLNEGVHEKQIISINFEDLQYTDLTDYKLVYEYIKPLLNPSQMNYIFLDEIQHVTQFERLADGLFIQKNIDLYITGSNAYFMSGDLATVLTGRYVELKMLPLSFREYYDGICLVSGQNQSDLTTIYNNYIQESSFPYTLQISGRKTEIREYISGIYSSILLKDVVARLKISDVMMLESVIRFIFDNIGNLLSTRKIANTMLSNGRKIDVKTVEKYLRGLMDSLLIYRATRYNIKGKQYLTTNDKYYLADVGLRYFLLGDRGADHGHVLENVVYLELLRRGYDVYVGVTTEGEVDFVAMNQSDVEYYQVAATVLDTATLHRELAPLQKINDAYPKFLLTFDVVGENSSYDGIRQLNVLKWMLGNEG